jgi:hypothetical protein
MDHVKSLQRNDITLPYASAHHQCSQSICRHGYVCSGGPPILYILRGLHEPRISSDPFAHLPLHNLLSRESFWQHLLKDSYTKWLKYCVVCRVSNCPLHNMTASASLNLVTVLNTAKPSSAMRFDSSPPPTLCLVTPRSWFCGFGK